MTAAALRVTRLTLSLCFLLPALWSACLQWKTGVMTRGDAVVTLGLAAVGLALSLAAGWSLRRLAPAIDAMAAEEAAFLDGVPGRWLLPAVAASAAGGLILELALIRWQGTVWEVFAFYKNFSLLSCFAGLGLGYALARRDRVPVVLVLPLLAVQVVFLTALRGIPRFAASPQIPVAEQLAMGVGSLTDWTDLISIDPFLGAVFLLTALTFVPVGQVCGRLMERAGRLRGYGWNLLGSLAGVLLMLGASALWAPPPAWFGPAFVVLLLLQPLDSRSLGVGLAAAMAVLLALEPPFVPRPERTYSPYQILERGVHGPRGLTVLRAAGHYYQKVLDLSPGSLQADAALEPLARYYELPYRLARRVGRVAVVGAGTGNDVAAALRRGAGHVDAVEIDPAIVRIGRLHHPERPYDDPRVAAVVDDARNFLRGSRGGYDLIVYGLLDSHTLLSHASSVRLDSFVYTVEGLRDARERLADGGVVSLSFSMLTPEIGRKLYLMMEEAFGAPPVCVVTRYDRSVLFAQSREGDLRLDPALLDGTDFEDRSVLFASRALDADASTDDWPFFYMPRRVYPVSYLGMLALVAALTVWLVKSFVPERPRPGRLPFFFMGAGFMLVETKAITELGLTFGNTWQVVGVVIAAVLVMAYLANLAVERIGCRGAAAPLALVLVSLGLGLGVSYAGGCPATPAGKLAAVVVLTCPLFFSGVAFSSLLARTGEAGGALALNLFGAVCGGLLEYNSMYFGFGFLYLIAASLYGAALAAELLARRAGRRPPSPAG